MLVDGTLSFKSFLSFYGKNRRIVTTRVINNLV